MRVLHRRRENPVLVRLPGRRGHRRRGARRGPVRRRRWFVLGLLALLAVAVGAPLDMRVGEVRVVGVGMLDPQTVVRASGLHGGERILLTRMGPVRRRVEALWSVRRAEVHRSLPSRVTIVVVERIPLARLDARPDLAADRDGRLFRIPAQAAAPSLSGWRGEATPGRRLDGSTTLLLRAYSRFPKQLRTRVSAILAGDDIALTLTDGTRVRMGLPEALVAKAAAAVAVLADAAVRRVIVEYVDVRAPGTPVMKELVPPTPSPPRAQAGGRPPAPPASKASPRPSATPARRTPAPLTTPGH